MMDQRGVAAEGLSHTCQRHNVTLDRGRLDSGMLFRGGSAALSETVAVAVHLDDVYAVCELVRQSAGQPVSLSDPNISVHSSNGRFVVTRSDPRS